MSSISLILIRTFGSLLLTFIISSIHLMEKTMILNQSNQIILFEEMSSDNNNQEVIDCE